MRITLGQKRFLIVWIAFHFIALLTNVIPIRGQYRIKEDERYDSYKTMYIFAAPDRSREKEFWPFVEIYEKDGYGYGRSYLRGIFYSYTFGAFLFYILLGFGIIYLPKLWKGKD